MAAAPFQPIPDSTQVHVDRLVGAQVGEFDVGARVVEGRYGTLYRARQRTSGKEATLEVLRTGLTGDDEEVKAANAIKCAGIADVFDFGQLPDGRRYRVMECLDGESLEQQLERRGRFTAAQTVQLLAQVAEVLQAAHAWALPHGSLGPSSIFVVRGAVKLIDFGLVKRSASLEGDLQALGALGFTLLGEAPGGELLTHFLRALLEKQVKDATAARKELLGWSPSPSGGPSLAAPPAPAWPAPPRRSRALPWAALALVLAAGGSAAFFFWPRPTPVETPAPAEEVDLLDDVVPDEPEVRVPEPAPTEPRPPSLTAPRRARPVPSAAALQEEISRLESRFRKQLRPDDDIDAALYVLNKQRLRLSGSPTEQDRKDVAQQLAGWRRSYLLRR